MAIELNVKHPPSEDEPNTDAPFLMKLVLLVFLLGYLSGTLWLVVDGWLYQDKILRAFLHYPDAQLFPERFTSALFTVKGALMGAAILDIFSFHKYIAVAQSFKKPHVWGYFFAPWLAAVLGLVVFALIQSGVLMITAGGESKLPKEVADLGFMAVGFLSGFGWYEVIQRIRKLVKKFFAEDETEANKQIEKSITEQIREEVNAATGASGRDAAGAASIRTPSTALMEEKSVPLVRPVINISEISLLSDAQGENFASSSAQVARLIGGKKLGYRLIKVPPGKRAWPFHAHYVNEEMVFVLSGEGTLRFGNKVFPITAGDFIAYPPGPEHPHQIINTSDQDITYICVSTMEEPEVFIYPDSEKFGVFAGSAPGGAKEKRTFSIFARQSGAVDYWDGEN